MVNPVPPAKRAYLSTEQRQADTVEAVIRLCGEEDPATLTTARIAEAVNLSQGALFRHFPNKNSLWEAVARWTAQQLTRRVFSLAEQHGDALQALEAMFLAHVGFVCSHPGIPRLMLGELQKPESTTAKAVVRQALDQYRQRVIALLETAIVQGSIAPGTDKQAAAVLYLGAIQGLVIQAMISDDISSARQSAPRIFGLFRAGLGGPTS